MSLIHGFAPIVVFFCVSCGTDERSRPTSLPSPGSGGTSLGLPHFDCGTDREGDFRTDLSLTGNRVALGLGALTTQEPRVIDLPLAARWVIPYERLENGNSWLLMLDSGETLVVDSAGQLRNIETDVGGDPPEVWQSDSGPRIVSAFAGRELFDDALPDARVVFDDEIAVTLVDPTDRYNHGILGDPWEAGAFEIFNTCTGVRTRVPISAPTVVEGTTPLLADIDEDGTLDVLVTLSNSTEGAWLAAYKQDGSLLAKSAPIGIGKRWRNQLAVASVGPQGEIEVIDVRVPHLDGIVEYFRLVGGVLVPVAQVAGFTSHVIATNNLDRGIVADANGDGQLDVIVPTLDRSELGILTRVGTGVNITALVPLSAPSSTNIAALDNLNGTASFAIGTEDANLFIWGD